MGLEEISALLAVIAATDRRKVGETDILTWHAAIGDLDFIEARSAVWQHFGHSTEWLMPAHIRRIVKGNREIARRTDDTVKRQIEAADQAASPMPAEVKALLEERWGPRESWDTFGKLGSRTPIRKPGEPDVPKHRQPSALGDVLKELPLTPSEALQKAREAQGVPGIPTKV